MRIALVSPETSSLHPGSGGIGSHFEALGVALAARGHETHLITTSWGIDDSEIWPYGRRVRLVVLDAGRPAGPTYPVQRALVVDRFLSRGRFDVVFAPEWGGLAARYALRRDRAPLLTNLATATAQVRELEQADPNSAGERLALATTERLERTQAVHSDGIVAISTALLRWSERMWGGQLPDPVVIPNGLDVAATVAAASSVSADVPLALPQGAGPVVVTTGRVSRWKGSYVLVEAMRKVWEEHPKSQLVFVGDVDSPRGRLFLEHCRRTLGAAISQVTFTGHLDRGRALRILADADLAVFPSLFEGFGNGCLEAKILGVPTVVTRGSGFDDYCEDGVDVLAAEPGDAADLARVMGRLLGDRVLAERVGAAAAVSARELDGSINADRLEKVFRRHVVESRRD